jgi:hypothetical protein
MPDCVFPQFVVVELQLFVLIVV